MELTLTQNNNSYITKLDDFVYDQEGDYATWYLIKCPTSMYVWGYRKNKRFSFHRYIYTKYINEIQPGLCIDHINGDPLDNRLENLRATTSSVNNANRKSGSKYVGVSKSNNKWKARVIEPSQHDTVVGYYDTEVEAAVAISKYTNKAISIRSCMI